MVLLVLLLAVASLGAAAPNRLVLSYVLTNQLRFDAGQQPVPVSVDWFYELGPTTTPVGSLSVLVERTGSFQLRAWRRGGRHRAFFFTFTSHAPTFPSRVVERFVTEWTTFALGNVLRVRFRIPSALSTEGAFEIGTALVSYRALAALSPGLLLEIPLPGGRVGLRLVNTDATNAIAPSTPSLPLAVGSLVLRNANSPRFPQLSMRCSVAHASAVNSTNATVWALPARTRDVFVGSRVTSYNVVFPLNLLIVSWEPAKQGPTLVCSLWDQASTAASFFAMPDSCLGAFNVTSASFASGGPVRVVTPNFDVTLVLCPTCPSPSHAASLAVYAVLFSALVVVMASLIL